MTPTTRLRPLPGLAMVPYLAIAIAGALCADAAVREALAGSVVGSQVVVDSANRRAYGSFGGARGSGESREFVGCRLTARTGRLEARCHAQDQRGVRADCLSEEPEVVGALQGLTSDSAVYFEYDLSGACTEVRVETGSYFAPKERP